MLQKKNIKLGIVNLIILLIFLNNVNILNAQETEQNSNNISVEINVLDKVSSKNTILKIKIGEEKKFQNLLIKVLKCENSKFDDDPEITAYLQVKDLKNTSNDSVFIFNGWTFASSPALKTFDHPVYDIWLVKCYS